MALARLLVGLLVSEEEVKERDVTSMLWQCWHEMEERAQHDEQSWKVRFGSRAGSATMVRSLRELVAGPCSGVGYRAADRSTTMVDG